MEIAIIKKLKAELSSKAITKRYHSIVEQLKEQLLKLKNLAETNYQLGLHHLRLHNMTDAEFRFRIVLLLQPDHPEALYNYAKCLFIRNKKEQATENLTKALKLRPNFSEVQYLLSVIANKTAPKEIPISIVSEYFDNAADKYDKEFNIRNGYKVPSDIVASLLPHLDKHHQYTVLDLGCGTGQCGLQFVHALPTFELYGIDISKNMLKIAAKINYDNQLPVYKQLIHQDCHGFLARTSHTYDIIIAGLSLHYQKTLAPTLKLLASTLNKRGYLVFAVEKSINDKVDANLNRNFENFCYTEEFVNQEIKKSGLKLIKLDHSSIKNDKLALICVCTN